MALKLEDKRAVVAEVSEVARNALSVVIANYQGISAVDMVRMRSEARKSGVYLRVIKNTLARRALADSPFACAQPALEGSTLLAFSHEDPGAAARLISKFAKENEKLVVKDVAVEGKLLGAKGIDKLAKMPTYAQAIAILMGTLQAPITQLTRTIAEPTAKLVRTVAAIAESKKEVA
jgi:large subunit ribosomal protein L10